MRDSDALHLQSWRERQKSVKRGGRMIDMKNDLFLPAILAMKMNNKVSSDEILHEYSRTGCSYLSSFFYMTFKDSFQ